MNGDYDGQQLAYTDRFRGQDCSGSRFVGADLAGADFSDANLSESNLRNARLTGASLARANLTRSRLTAASLAGADLSGSDLSFAHLAGADLHGANLSGAVLTGASLFGANLRGAKLDRSHLIGADLEGADLSDASLAAAHLENTDLRGATLEHASLPGARLNGVNLNEARLRGADLSDTVFAGLVDFAETDFTEAVLNRADLSGARLLFLSRNLRGADLTAADLRETDLRGADLRGTSLRQTDLRNANLDGAQGVVVDRTQTGHAIFAHGSPDHWSVLRRYYSGHPFSFALLFLIIFLVPYVARTLFWAGISELERYAISHHEQLDALCDDLEKDDDPQVRKWSVKLRQRVQALRSWFPDHFQQRTIFSVLFGLDGSPWQVALTLALLLFNLLRGVLVFAVGPMKDEEDRTGVSPPHCEWLWPWPAKWKSPRARTGLKPFRGYGPLIYVHYFVRLMMWFSIVAGVILGALWLSGRVWVPKPGAFDAPPAAGQRSE